MAPSNPDLLRPEVSGEYAAKRGTNVLQAKPKHYLDEAAPLLAVVESPEPAPSVVIAEEFNPWSLGFFGVVCNYMIVGLVRMFLYTPTSMYMINTLDASPMAQNTLSVLTDLPWSFKLFFGLLSDGVPVCGYR